MLAKLSGRSIEAGRHDGWSRTGHGAERRALAAVIFYFDFHSYSQLELEHARALDIRFEFRSSKNHPMPAFLIDTNPNHFDLPSCCANML